MDESGEIVEPAIPSFLGSLQTEGRATREDLAHWLVAPISDGGVGSHSHVTANRIWSIFFGAGLCRSADDFGGQVNHLITQSFLTGLHLSFLTAAGTFGTSFVVL